MRRVETLKHGRRLALENLEQRNLLAGDMLSQVMTGPADTEPVASDIGEFLSVLQTEGSITIDQSFAEISAGDQRGFIFSLFYSVDGSGNNLHHPAWGSVGEELLRLTTAEYADGISSPAGDTRVSAREVSNAIADQSGSITNDRSMTDFVWQWGQFVDHDIDLTGHAEPVEPFPIPVPTGDLHFDPDYTGTQVIDLNRSVHNPASGTSAENPRQQLNQITAFIDGSNVYGSDEVRTAELRTFTGGRLKTSEGDLMPFNVNGLPNAGGPASSLFLGGDIRANEQVGLTAMHTLFVREHNRIADNFTTVAPFLSDEWVYQLTRSIVIAEMQAITFNEFLPALLGDEAIPAYQGYDRDLDPGIGNAFSTAAYRFGHSMLSPELQRLDGDGNVIPAGNLPLRNAFFNPQEIQDYGIEPLLAGLANQEAQEIDSMVVDDVRNFLFGDPGEGGFDLASLNIQRGRDHGLCDYNQVRADMGLDPVKRFSDITSDPQLQQALAATYGSVHDVDAWVGGLSEDHSSGSVGELVSETLVDQFTRLRDGDRLWYQRIFRGPFRQVLDQTTLAKVIHRNTELTGLQPNVFFMADAQPDTDPDLNVFTDPELPVNSEGPGNLRAERLSRAGLPALAVDEPVRQAPIISTTAWQPTRDSRSVRDSHATRGEDSASARVHAAAFADIGNGPFAKMRLT